jgi:subtilisin family serine protease
MAAAPVGEQQFEEMQTLSLDVTPELDPRLQLAIANHRTGKPMLTFASATADELPVVARVKSVEAWEALTDVFAGTSMGQAADGTWIVTGRVPVQRLEVVRGAPTVVSLKASQPIHPTLKFTVGAMSVAAAALPAGAAPNGASGVVVGIIDFGCDFAHAHFLQKGKTRILKLWDQGGIAKGDSPFGYGRVYSRGDINSALVKAKPYAALGYGPQPDSAFQQGTHGTHVMDIAAGNGGKAGQPGVAPKAGLVFVEVASSDIAWSGPESVKQTFGDSVQLLEAVRFVFDTAGDQPCVCNLSLGTNGGPHDGTSLVEQGLDAIVKEKPNRAIVIAASNSQEDGIHTTGTVPANGSLDVKWRQRSAGGGELEFWYPKGRNLEVTLVAPNGTAFGPVQAGNNLAIGKPNKIAIFISSRLGDPNNGDNVVGIWAAAGLAGDEWTVRLRSTDGQPVDFHGWIERNDGAQASFSVPVLTHTLGSISTGHNTIVVGSYDARDKLLSLSSFSSAGPTRDGRNKPEIAAPGHHVMAARSRTGDGVVRKSGTSMAAPAVTGLIALMLAEAKRKKVSLTIDAIRAKLLGTVLLNPPAIAPSGWDGRYGGGRANARAIP